MATTPVYGFHYQSLGDTPDGADLGADLAADVEAKFVTVDAAIAALAKLTSVAYSGTTDANGFLVVSHGAGGTPLAAWAVTTNPASSFATFWGVDTMGPTTVRLRFASAVANTALVSSAVQGRLFVVRA